MDGSIQLLIFVALLPECCPVEKKSVLLTCKKLNKKNENS